MNSLRLILILLLFAQQAFAHAYPPDNDHYLRVRIEASLPLRMANSLHHRYALCNAADACLPLFQIDSDLSQTGPSNIFRQVEYFSFQRVRALAIQLGASESSAFPEALASYSVAIDATLPGPTAIHAQGKISPLYERESATALRDQSSTASTTWQMTVPFSSSAQDISLRSEISILRVPGNDVTAELTASSAEPESVLRRLRDYHIVFVTGTDGYKAKFFSTEYYDSFQAWLTKNGEKNARLIPGTNRPLAEQAQYFLNFFTALLQAETNLKPVIFVGYSIANSNFMEFLLQYGKQFKEKNLLAGWIAVNASFLGNPLMEDVYNNPAKREVAQMMSSDRGLEDIRYLTRDSYLDTNYWKIIEAVQLLPAVITVSSRINAPDLASSRHARHLELYARGIENDGSTGTFSHFIPGTDYVIFDGTDHELLNKGTNGYGADPYKIYLKLFQRILEHSPERSTRAN